MAITKEIKIQVDNKDVDKVNKSLDKLEGNLKNVSKESANTKKGVDDVASNGGAIAILDQLTGGLATQFKNAYESTRLFNISLKGTKTALIATGIGALVVALGLVVAYWDDIVEFIKGANKELEIQLTLKERLKTETNSQLTLIKKEIELLKSQGVDTKEALARQRQKTLELITQNLLYQQQLEKQLLIEETDARQLTLGEKALNLLRLGQGLGFKTVSEITEEEQTKLDDIKAKIQKAKEETLDLQKAIVDLDKVEVTPTATPTKVEGGKRKAVKGIETSQADDIEQSLLSSRLINETKELEDRETQDRINKYREETRKEDAENELIFAENVQTAKENLVTNGLNLLGSLAKKGSALAKGIAIAEVVRNQVSSVSGIISNTAVANAKAAAASPLTAGQPFVAINTISAGLGIAGGLVGAAKAIKDINSESKTPSRGSPSGGSGSGASAPSFNLVQGTQGNQIQNSINQQNQTPLKAYVVSGDMTTQQSLDRNAKTNSSL